MKLHIYEADADAKEAKRIKNKRLEWMGIIVMIVLGLLMTFANMIDKYAFDVILK